MERLTPDPAGIERAAGLLRAGAVVAFPTDTVYGLGAATPEAVSRVYGLKGREASKPLILMAAGAADLGVRLNAAARTLAERHWPGPLTLVVPDGHRGTVGVRVPAHELMLALLRRTGPLWTTSANRSGEPDCLTADEVAADLPEVDAVLDGGRAPGGVPSTVLDVTGLEPRVLRAGAIPAEALQPPG